MKTQQATRVCSQFISKRRPLLRRTFLKSAGVAIALPFLDVMASPFARAADSSRCPRRFLAIDRSGETVGQLVVVKNRSPAAGAAYTGTLAAGCMLLALAILLEIAQRQGRGGPLVEP